MYQDKRFYLPDGDVDTLPKLCVVYCPGLVLKKGSYVFVKNSADGVFIFEEGNVSLWTDFVM